MRSNSEKSYKTAGGFGIVACGFCCALPFIGALAGIGALATAGYYLERIGIVALGIAGIFIVMSLLWSMKFDNYLPDTYNLLGT